MRGKGKLSICISSKSRSLKSSSCFTYLVWQRSPHLLFPFCVSVTLCWSPELLCIGKLNCSPLPPVSPKPSRLVGAIGVWRWVSFSVLKNSCSSIFFSVPFGVGREKTLTVEITSTFEGKPLLFFDCLPLFWPFWRLLYATCDLFFLTLIKLGLDTLLML